MSIKTMRQLVHALRTPLATLELTLERMPTLLQSILEKPSSEGGPYAQLQQAFTMATMQCQQITEHLTQCTDPRMRDEDLMEWTTSKDTQIACCYFPTTVVFIDDDELFLSEIQQTLREKKILSTGYCNPGEAFTVLKNTALIADLKTMWLHPLETEELDIQMNSNQPDIPSIAQVTQEPKRFNRVSVIVVDYHMQEKNGLDFCREISGKPFKKILMTGDDDYPRAVAAFNAGLIDRFILKGQPQFAEKLALMIQELEYASFMEMSFAIYDCLPIGQPIAWTDPIYRAFILDWIEQQNLQEYYWLDSTGSLLGLTAEGRAVACVVRTAEELTEFELIVHEQQGSSELAETLSQRNKMVVLLTADEHHLPVQEWSTRLYPVHCLQGRENYYYAVLQHEALSPLLSHKIVSYQEALAIEQ